MIEKITDHNLERYDSRLKEWCDRKFFEKGNYEKYETTEEASAVAFYPAPDIPLEGKVKFSFKETPPASGDKSPTNPSTITGVSSVNVTRCGKNLFCYPYYQSTRNTGGVVFTANQDGTVKINGTASGGVFFSICDSALTGDAVSSKIRIVRGLDYALSLNIVSGSITGNLYIGAGNASNQRGLRDYPQPNISVLVDWSYSGTEEYMRYYLYAPVGTVFNDLVIAPQLELGSTATSFEPYSGTDYTISLNNTYYGGEIDLATGIMTVTWVCLDLDSIKDKFSYGYNVSDGVRNSRRYAVKLDGSISGLPAIILGAPVGSCSCTHFLRKDFDVPSSDKSFGVFEQQLNARWFMFYDDSLTITDDSKTNAENLQAFQNWLATQKANGTPVEYIYMLNTSFTVQLTSQQILSLSQIDKYTPRLNTVYTDADSIQISYLKSPIRDEYEKTQAILSLGGNS